MRNKIEAILFTLGKYISVEELARILDTNKQRVQSLLNQLEKEYSTRDTAITIQKQENKYKINIKKNMVT